MSADIPSFSISPVSSSDLPIIIDFLRASKLQLTINRLLFKDWPDEANQLALYTTAVESGFNDPDRETLKVVDDGTGDAVGHLAISHKRAVTKGSAPSEEAPNRGSNLPKGLNPVIVEVVDRTVKQLNEPFEQTEHLELTHIYVKPSYRKQGIGASLVKLFLERGKQAGLPVSVTSEPEAHAFFLRMGFKDTGFVDIDLSKYATPYCGFGVFRISGMVYDA